MAANENPRPSKRRQFRAIVEADRKARHRDLRPAWRRYPEVVVIGLVGLIAWINAVRLFGGYG
jgi:hypothetical protein